MDDVFRIKLNTADGKWYIRGAWDRELADVNMVLWGFHDRACAAAVCETLNALVIADAMSACIDEGVAA